MWLYDNPNVPTREGFLKHSNLSGVGNTGKTLERMLSIKDPKMIKITNQLVLINELVITTN